MKYYSDILLFLLIYYGCTTVGAILMKCPSYQLHFQKIVGFRPSLDYATSKSLLYQGDGLTPISYICWEKCRQDADCMSYLILLENSECYGFSVFDRSIHYDVLPSNVDLIMDPNAVYFEKTCLEVPASCKTKLWAITKIPGNSLVLQGKKTLPTLVTRRECAERCIFESQFQCLSASFSASYKNNFSRLGRTLKYDDIVGQCILSEKDKTIQPDAFRTTSNDEEYIENQCYDRPAENENCSYELYSNSTFVYSELKHSGLTQKECQQNCSYENRFYCQGVTYVGDVEHSECFLHSEDLISMGPRSLQLKANSVYMRRVKCLDVSVVCSFDEMIIRYSPSDWFRGKIYVSSHSDDCSVQGNGTRMTTLRLPIGTEIRESRCGVLRAYEVKGTFQRTFISTLVVIQNNPHVQTQGDRLIKVGCIVNNASFTDGVPDDIALESSLAFTQTDLPSEGTLLINSTAKMPKILMQIIDLDRNSETNDVQVGQNLELRIIIDPFYSPYDIRAVSLAARSNNHNAVYLLDRRGCPTDISVFPPLEKVVTKHVKMLRAKFHAFKFGETSVVNFDVMVHFCLNECPPVNCTGGIVSFGKRRKRDAKDQDFNQQPPLENPNTMVQISNPFSAISFPGPANYGNSRYINTQNSPADAYQYSVGDDSAADGISITEASISQISRNNFTDNTRILGQNLELPLKLQIHVRGPNVGETKSLIYGENNRILVAAIDSSRSDNICINQSLLIALLIFWIVFQILLMVGCCYLIRRYKGLAAMDDDRSSLHKIHESLEYADSSRRVHWADQGSGFSFAT